jgi:hypothetical protein
MMPDIARLTIYMLRGFRLLARAEKTSYYSGQVYSDYRTVQ